VDLQDMLSQSETYKLLKHARRNHRRSLVITALICLAPPLHLIFDLIEKNTNRLGLDIIMTIVAMCYFIYEWSSYKKKSILFEEIKEEILKEEFSKK
jgi:hypothetical protein